MGADVPADQPVRPRRAVLQEARAIDEDATLTQFVGAWINLHKGGDNTKEAAYTYEELIDKFGSSLTLLNGLAVAKMHQKDYDEAQKRLQEALGKKSAMMRTPLINLITCSAHMGKEEKEINRYQQLLYGAHPNHPLRRQHEGEGGGVRSAGRVHREGGLEEDAEGNLVKVGN